MHKSILRILCHCRSSSVACWCVAQPCSERSAAAAPHSSPRNIGDGDGAMHPAVPMPARALKIVGHMRSTCAATHQYAAPVRVCQCRRAAARSGIAAAAAADGGRRSGSSSGAGGGGGVGGDDISSSIGGSASGGEGEQLAAQFSAHVNRLALVAPLQHRTPSPLDPPTAAVAAICSALQISGWPEPHAGVDTAFAFTKPLGCEELTRSATSGVAAAGAGAGSSAATPRADHRVRSWAAGEDWLTLESFRSMLALPPYDVLLDCDSWKPAGAMVFPDTRAGQRALQAVEVVAAQRPAQQQSSSSSSSAGPSAGSSCGLRRYLFTFLLELVERGAYAGCWMAVGVRPGDYTL